MFARNVSLRNAEACIMRLESLNIYEIIALKVTPANIDKLLEDYAETLLSEDRKRLIKLFLLEKVNLMAEIIGREEA
ncbi:hypothetical protein JCM17380_23580 [Desulfosporosinus burensis]